MKDILLLTDYKGRFGSKHNDNPYRSGMDKDYLNELFRLAGYNTKTMCFSNVVIRDPEFKKYVILYTSSEDRGSYYKSYIEDIVLGLELSGNRVLPPFQFLRAHHNKVFMEIVRDLQEGREFTNLRSHKLGVVNDLERLGDLDRSWVIKSSEGANSTGVKLGKGYRQISSKIRSINQTRSKRKLLHELIRSIKYRGYIRDSLYTQKYILQEFIPDLKNDWKIYVFGDRYYVFYRPVLKRNKFRASGGGYENYLYGSAAPRPPGLLDFARKISLGLNVPHLSLDIAWNGREFYLFEFQALYFGTAGILNSDCYYCFTDKGWEEINCKTDIETAYAHGVIEYLNRTAGS
jgi:glutathione synthase/RimK-type ligase-like ATP-grasp enzyme